MINILLNVHGGDDTDGVYCGLLRLTPESIEKLMEQIAQTKAMKESDQDVYGVERWSYLVHWFDRGWLADDDGDDLWVAVDEAGKAKISDEEAEKLMVEINAGLSRDGEGASTRTECNVLVTDDDSCYWKCIVKHTDIRLETSQLYVDNLQEFLKE